MNELVAQHTVFLRVCAIVLYGLTGKDKEATSS